MAEAAIPEPTPTRGRPRVFDAATLALVGSQFPKVRTRRHQQNILYAARAVACLPRARPPHVARKVWTLLGRLLAADRISRETVQVLARAICETKMTVLRAKHLISLCVEDAEREAANLAAMSGTDIHDDAAGGEA